MNQHAAPPTRFMRHPWPFPSGFSLIGCTARINVLYRRDLLGWWWTELEINQKQSGLDGTKLADLVGGGALAATFGLSPAELPLAFGVYHWLPKSLADATWDFDSRLQFCPRCLHEGFHTELFQLPWWCKCPIHACSLDSQCPRCQQPIPLDLHLSPPDEPGNIFRCSHCRHNIADTRAIVMASRGEASRQWHRVVAAHFRWARSIDDAFVLAPLLDLESPKSRDLMLNLVAAAEVPWPPELIPYVASTGNASALGIRRVIDLRVRERSASLSLPLVSELRAELVRNADVRSIAVGQSEIFIAPSDHAKCLVRLERRLSKENGQPLTQTYWDRHHNFHQSSQRTDWDPELESLESGAPRFRDRGYRYREHVMHLETSKAGTTELSIFGSELLRLSAVKILRALQPQLRDKALVKGSIEHELLQWWYLHFLTLALIDGTISAIHAKSYFSSETPRPHRLPGWPPVNLDLHSPGHEWTIAATVSDGYLCAYVISVPSDPIVSAHMSEPRIGGNQKL